jgi:hypothetical protein
MIIVPDAPPFPELGVKINRSPLVLSELDPDEMETRPPTSTFAVPAERVIEPPIPALVLPTPKEIEPPRALLDAPVPKFNDPLSE